MQHPLSRSSAYQAGRLAPPVCSCTSSCQPMSSHTEPLLGLQASGAARPRSRPAPPLTSFTTNPPPLLATTSSKQTRPALYKGVGTALIQDCSISNSPTKLLSWYSSDQGSEQLRIHFLLVRASKLARFAPIVDAHTVPSVADPTRITTRVSTELVLPSSGVGDIEPRDGILLRRRWPEYHGRDAER